MAKYTQGKCRLCRREGVKLFLKGERCSSPKCPIEKKGAVPPGQHGQKRARRLSGYGLQLREKQKTKRIYGILEKPFRNYFKKAFKVRGEETGKVLLQLLESRLDNVVYRLGFTPSRSVARQLVTHGLVLVEDKKVNIPSYQVKIGQTITLAKDALAIEPVKKALAEKGKKIPLWLQRKAIIGRIARLPEKEEIDSNISDQLIVEFYSR
jgi:small subunit ribosomal protein S4